MSSSLHRPAGATTCPVSHPGVPGDRRRTKDRRAGVVDGISASRPPSDAPAGPRASRSPALEARFVDVTCTWSPPAPGPARRPPVEQRDVHPRTAGPAHPSAGPTPASRHRQTRRSRSSARDWAVSTAAETHPPACPAGTGPLVQASRCASASSGSRPLALRSRSTAADDRSRDRRRQCRLSDAARGSPDRRAAPVDPDGGDRSSWLRRSPARATALHRGLGGLAGRRRAGRWPG